MKKSIIKNILLVGGVTVLAVGMLTGCGKKNDETKTYDKENEVTQSITNNVNYAEKLSTEEKIEFAYYLHVFNGDFKSTQDLSSENILRTLTDRNVNVVDYKKTTEKSVTDMFTDYNSSYGEIRVFEESELKKAAKDLLGVDLSNENNNFSDTYLKRTLKYKDGKYYYYLEFADGEYLTIKNISNNDNTYTFFALSALDSEVLDISEYTKYEAVIENGVIKSCKEAMNTENKTNDSSISSNKNDVNTANEALRKALKDQKWLKEQHIYEEINDGVNTFKPDLYFIKINDINSMPVYLVKSHVMDSAHTSLVTYRNGNVYVSKTRAGSDYCDEEVDIEKNLVKATNISAGFVTIYKIKDGEFEEIAEYENEDEANIKYSEESFQRINIKLTNENIDKYVK